MNDDFDVIFRVAWFVLALGVFVFMGLWVRKGSEVEAGHEAEYCQRFDMIPVGGFCMTEAEIVLRRIPEAR